jgi:hypothetical protein
LGTGVDIFRCAAALQVLPRLRLLVAQRRLARARPAQLCAGTSAKVRAKRVNGPAKDFGSNKGWRKNADFFLIRIPFIASD